MFGLGNKNKAAKSAPAGRPAAAVKPVASVYTPSIPRGPMKGLMQGWPLTVDKILTHAHVNHGQREIVARTVEGPIVRTT